MAIDQKTLDEAFASLSSYDWGQDPKPLATIDAAVVAAHGDTALRADLERRLAASLGAGSRAAKDYACRKLSLVGSAASVPAAAALLADPETSHMARYALERIGGPDARAAIRKALGTVDGDLVPGMISSLADMADADAVPALARILSGGGASAIAAARALGRIATADAANALAGVKAVGGLVDAVRDARLSIAESRLAAGDRAGARSLYEAVSKDVGDVPAGHHDRVFRVAAIRGMIASRDESST